jgi:hypothetical protein
MGSFVGNEGQVEPTFDSDHGTIGIPMILGVKSTELGKVCVVSKWAQSHVMMTELQPMKT